MRWAIPPTFATRDPMNQVDLFGDQVMPEQHGSKLGGDWDYPPFSVWNAREGWWQDRKRAWLSLGIKSELGRGGGGNLEHRNNL